jgi:hypothetical protein
VTEADDQAARYEDDPERVLKWFIQQHLRLAILQWVLTGILVIFLGGVIFLGWRPGFPGLP